MTFGEYVNQVMDLLSLRQDWALNRDLWKDSIWGKHITLA